MLTSPVGKSNINWSVLNVVFARFDVQARFVSNTHGCQLVDSRFCEWQAQVNKYQKNTFLSSKLGFFYTIINIRPEKKDSYSTYHHNCVWNKLLSLFQYHLEKRVYLPAHGEWLLGFCVNWSNCHSSQCDVPWNVWLTKDNWLSKDNWHCRVWIDEIIKYMIDCLPLLRIACLHNNLEISLTQAFLTSELGACRT